MEVFQGRAPDHRSGDRDRPSLPIDHHVPAAQVRGEAGAVVLAGEDDIRRAPEVGHGEPRPSLAVIAQFIRDQVDLTIGMNLFQPRTADLPWDPLRGMMRQDHDQPIHAGPRRIDQVLVPPMRRIELADDEPERHAGASSPRGAGC